MNISKKTLMSFLMALTSLIAMAQPYYHVMKQDGNNLTEETMYNAKNYKIRVDMVEPKKKIEGEPESEPESEPEKPKDAIGGKITIESYDCNKSKLKRSFYFTNKGNVYYDSSTGKFGFEENQFDYPVYSEYYSEKKYNHCGLFNWCGNLSTSIGTLFIGYVSNATETTFYFANPDNLGRLQEDLGNERWAVLSYCEWDYVLYTLGERGWTVDDKMCYLIDTTPNKSLLSELRRKNSGNPRNLSIEEFKSYEARGLVCLPACGCRLRSSVYSQGSYGYYWSCTPDMYKETGELLCFGTYASGGPYWANYGGHYTSAAVRLVILAD